MGNNIIVLFSYETCISLYNEEEGKVYLLKSYNKISNTTLKHVYLFLQKYFMKYICCQKDINNLIDKGWIILIDTL